MQIDALAVDLRPRPMAEAADLGLLLVQRHAGSVWRCFAPVWMAVTLLTLAATTLSPWLAFVLGLMLRPWLDRSLLFVLARAVFGQATRFEDLWRQRGAVWGRQLPSTLLWRWASPWRSYTQAIFQLEGQRGKAGRARRKLMLNGRRGAALGMQSVFALAELALDLSALAVVFWLAGQGHGKQVASWLFGDQQGAPAQLVVTAVQSLALLAVEPFFVAAGFLMYLNRRVELEAWDIEQEFRRAFG